MTIIELTSPMVEPLTLVEIRAHLRLDTEDEDPLLLALAIVAREHLEWETGLVLATRDFRLCLDDWPADGIVTIPRGPVRVVTSVTVYEGEVVLRPRDRLSPRGEERRAQRRRGEGAVRRSVE